MEQCWAMSEFWNFLPLKIFSTYSLGKKKLKTREQTVAYLGCFSFKIFANLESISRTSSSLSYALHLKMMSGFFNFPQSTFNSFGIQLCLWYESLNIFDSEKFCSYYKEMPLNQNQQMQNQMQNKNEYSSTSSHLSVVKFLELVS